MRDSKSPDTAFNLEPHPATLCWNGGQHTLTIAQFSITGALNKILDHGQKDLL
jgi:hypothetical protein